MAAPHGLPRASACCTPLISLHALQRARTTIEDFTLSYLPMHGLAPQDGLLRFLDVLVYTSAALYELDEENERLTAAGVGDEASELPGARQARPRRCAVRPLTARAALTQACRCCATRLRRVGCWTSA